MQAKIFITILILFGAISFKNSVAQEPASKTKHVSVKTIWDIPHKTLWQKWMWIHRTVVFEITKQRPVNYDTAYIKSYSKRLVITLPVSTRFLKFSLLDSKSGNKLTFVPNLQSNLGISVSSRWASFVLNTGVKIFNDDTGNKGKTEYQDCQLNLYGRNITTDMFVQYYSSFYIKNSKSYNSYVSNKPYSVRSDVNVLNLGVSTYFIRNHKKFSYRNSFAFVEQQKKSTGSLLFGIYYSFFELNGKPSLIIPPFRSSFDTLSYIQHGQAHNFGLNLGYIYTRIFLKKCYATASLVQGIGGEQVVFKQDDNLYRHHFVGGTGKLNVRLALGYDNGRYFVGSMGMFDYIFSRGNINPTLNYSFGKFMIYIGYRFSVLKPERKLLRKLKLIDY